MKIFQEYVVRRTGLGLLGLLFLFYIPTASATESSTDIVILKQLGELRKEIQSLRKEVGQLRKELKNVARPGSPPVIPPPKRIDLSQSDTRTLGNAEATVGIVEFTDYQCPFCQRFHTKTFSKLKEAYIDTGKVKFISRDFPLGNHPEAGPAAVAARCAEKQNAFWKMRDELFSNQEQLGENLYRDTARKLHLNTESFSSCLQDSNELMAVDVDQAYGQSIGITGTPSFFIGRLDGEALVDIQPIVGAQNFAMFSKIIDPLIQ